MKRLFAFLLTTLLLLSMAAVTVQADEAAPSYSIKLSHTGGAAGENVTVEYSLVCSNVKSLMVQPEVPDGFTLVKDEWKIKGMLAETYVTKDDDGKTVYGEPATFTAASSFDANGVIYTATYEVKESTANGDYPIGFDMLRIKVMPKGGEETPLYIHDVTGTTPVDEGTDALTVEDGNIHVHKHGDDCMIWVEKSDSSCITYGCKKAHWECSENHLAFEGENVPGGYDLTKEMPTKDYRKPLSTHTFEDEANYFSARPATCTEDGYKEDYQICDVCGDKFDEDFAPISEADFAENYLIPASGHKWGEWEETKAASCTEAGSRKRTCTNGCGATETEPIEMLAHDWSDWSQTKAPTCQAEGEESRNCKREGCGEVETRPIQKLEHDWSEWSQTKAPTCQAEGEESRSCAVGKEIETRPVAKLAHDWSDWSQTKAPTCQEDGEESRNCKREGCGEVETRPIEKLAHDWSDWSQTKAPSCKEEGEESRTCSVGNETETRPVAKLAHTWSEWEVTKKPTTTEKGLRVHTCSVCQETEQEDIPMLDHEPEPEKIEIETETPVVTENGQVIVPISLTNTPAEDPDDAVAAIELTLTIDSTQLMLDETSLPAGIRLKEASDGSTDDDPDTITLIIPNPNGSENSNFELVFKVVSETEPGEQPGEQPNYTVEITGVTALGVDGKTVDSAEVTVIEPTNEPTLPDFPDFPDYPTIPHQGLPSSFEQAMSYYRNQQKIKKAAEEAAAKKAAEEAAKAAAEAAKAAEEAAKADEAPAIADTWTNPYIDVAVTDPYYDAVRYATEAGLVNGMTVNEFGPAITLDRSMFVTILARKEGVDPAAYATTSFTDVEPIGDWNYAPNVEWAAQNGIVLGYGNGKFGPKDTITVEQAVVILARYAKYIGIDTTSEMTLDAFTDAADVSEWAVDAMAWAVENGIYTGVNGALNPQSHVARSLLVVMLYNFANSCEK